MFQECCLVESLFFFLRLLDILGMIFLPKLYIISTQLHYGKIITKVSRFGTNYIITRLSRLSTHLSMGLGWKIFGKFFPIVRMICFACLDRLHSYFFNATQGLVMYVLRILWGKKRAISPFLQNSCIMGFALHKCRGRTGRTRVPKGHTACWVMHRIKYILTHVQFKT